MKLPEDYALPFPVFLAGPDGHVLQTNALWQGILPPVAGAHWLEGFPELQRAELDPAWQRCVHDGTAFQVDTRITLPTGESVWFHLHCQRVSIDGGASGTVQVLGMLFDTTELTLRQAEISTILDTAVDAVITIDEHGQIESFNQAATKLFHYQAHEVIGGPVTVLMGEPHRSDHDDYLRHYLTTGEKKIIGIGRELEAVTRENKVIPIYLAVSEIHLAGRRRFIGIIRDLSEQYAAREAIAEQRERLAHVGRLSTMGEMAASIAHEINQPLTAISMYAQAGMRLIERANPDLAKLADALDKLNTQSLRAGAIIERIQRFARPQEGRREQTPLNALLTDLLKLTEGDARLQDIRIEFDFARDLPDLLIDPIQIQQVALNLIRNAIDAMKEIRCRHGNLIRISTRRTGDSVEVAVADQGMGVAAAQKDRLFNAFHTTKEDGMGMGLSICRSIIVAHGGTLSYRDNSPHGATFFFTLPARSDTDD